MVNESLEVGQAAEGIVIISIKNKMYIFSIMHSSVM